jgi:hypothetical protein
MRFVRKVLGQILRPFYKAFFERPLWWFLARVKAFLLAEIGPQIAGNEHRLAAIEERLRSLEANFGGQWSALEELLLAMYRQPEVQVYLNGTGSALRDDATVTAAGHDQTNEQNNIH